MSVMSEKPYERHAWIVFFLVFGILGIIMASLNFVRGTTNPVVFEISADMTWNEFVTSNPGLAALWTINVRS